MESSCRGYRYHDNQWSVPTWPVREDLRIWGTRKRSSGPDGQKVSWHLVFLVWAGCLNPGITQVWRWRRKLCWSWCYEMDQQLAWRLRSLKKTTVVDQLNNLKMIHGQLHTNILIVIANMISNSTRSFAFLIVSCRHGKSIKQSPRRLSGHHPGFQLQCIQKFFPKLCLILKEWFLTRFPPNFQERFLMSSASPEFVFWGPKIKQFCFKQV